MILSNLMLPSLTDYKQWIVFLNYDTIFYKEQKWKNFNIKLEYFMR